jgi:hypothetical protein
METQLDGVAIPAEQRFRPSRLALAVFWGHLGLERPTLHTRHLRSHKLDIFHVPGGERVIGSCAGSLDHELCTDVR